MWLTHEELNEFYQAFIRKDSNYEGIFFVGVKSTGIFCRPTCPARKPQLEKCEFFQNAQDALLAGYKPCKRCQPLSLPNGESPIVRSLIEAVEAEPERRWTDEDFRLLGVDSSTVRRQFKKRFGMTFVAYARARRMGLALKQIRNGTSVIEAQQEAGYESGSGFRDAFSRILGVPPKQAGLQKCLKAEWLDTPLGPMIAVADEEALYLLEFTDRRGLEREIERLRNRMKFAIVPGKTNIIDRIDKELTAYFSGQSKTFETPIALLGSEFQQLVWHTLQTIPYAKTCSYAEIAQKIGKSKSVRAVAQANGSNQLAIIVPCHRVIGADGNLCGYGGGLARKKWLIEHEEMYARHEAKTK